MTGPAHLVSEVSDRGFQRLPPVADSYAGTTRAYESSAASSAHVWLTITSNVDTRTPGVGTAHLTVDQARQIADQLNWLADHHYQNGDPEVTP